MDLRRLEKGYKQSDYNMILRFFILESDQRVGSSKD